MAKINILDSSVYNRIAAGEVVDRPYSVVKEFVENSLDAGAKNITINIERGGKDLIQVTDDGAGIEKSELRSAFLPHATSKICKAEDLGDIRTLGFRGEALASIASVSNARIRSRAEGASEAYEITCSGGKMGDVTPCALGAGTEITAENLFFNTPVRARFLKTDKGEEGEISNFVSRFVLGNPSVSFRYYVDGKLALQSYGGGLEEAVASVYGSSVISQCYRIDAVRHGIKIHGYLGKPSFTKANRTYQNTFVNGRYVVNNTISSAVSNAYGNYLMKRQYPFYVLFIDVPPEVVDVNVHPNKADVRFENNQVIYGSIYSVISAVLDGNASALDYVMGGGTAVADEQSHSLKSDVLQPIAERETRIFEEQKNVLSQGKGYAQVSPDHTERQRVFTDELLENYKKESTSSDIDSAKKRDFRDEYEVLKHMPKRSEYTGGEMIEFHDSGISPVKEEEKKSEPDVFEENKKYLQALEQKAKQQKFIFENAQFRGVLFNTYLLYEEGENVYLIDQHAAHERLIFDRLKEEMEQRKVARQPMLIPYVLNLNREEFSFLSEQKWVLEEIGFEMEEFGSNCYKISAVPVDLQEIDLSSFFAEILREVGSLRAIRLSDLLRDKLAMAACKHAVKGGMALTDSEKQKLFEMLHGDLGLKCPHGRPVAVRLSKTEIEKMFKRIV